MDRLESQSCQNVGIARTKKLEPTESKFCVTYGQKLDPTDSITETRSTTKTDLVYNGWSYKQRRRRTCLPIYFNT
jgi:hypothetical protein